MRQDAHAFAGQMFLFLLNVMLEQNQGGIPLVHRKVHPFFVQYLSEILQSLPIEAMPAKRPVGLLPFLHTEAVNEVFDVFL